MLNSLRVRVAYSAVAPRCVSRQMTTACSPSVRVNTSSTHQVVKAPIVIPTPIQFNTSSIVCAPHWQAMVNAPFVPKSIWEQPNTVTNAIEASPVEDAQEIQEYQLISTQKRKRLKIKRHLRRKRRRKLKFTHRRIGRTKT
mmetsp:Transcript_502/g.596  ORF Transcript_502/g.596 Transcript_502/m.596 type:complete len:141 (-) Transcript_502:31-453(-)